METEQAIRVVRDDAALGVMAWFPSDEEEPLQVVSAGAVENTGAVMVQWIHRGFNRGDPDPFIGLASTDHEVEVHGITLVSDGDDGEPDLQRYVDWAGVFDQLGLALVGRVRVSEHPGHIS